MSEDQVREIAPVMMPIGGKVSSHNPRYPMARVYENAAQRNHQQSLARLADRGGLVWAEAAAIVEMRPFFRMDATEAERIVRTKLLNQEQPS